MKPRIHIWRYDATTPTEERPWIVSSEAVCEPYDFQTWEEAVAFVNTIA